MPRCICQCQREAEEQRKAAEERQRRMERIKRRKAQGLQDRYLYDYTFANDNGQNPLMDKARAYVENWKEMCIRDRRKAEQRTPMTPNSTITVTLWTHPPAWKTISRSRPFPRRIF